MLSLRLYCFLNLILSCKYWIIVYAYDGVCENNVLPSMFCNCDTRHQETTVGCFVTEKLGTSLEAWRALKNVENLVHLKLNPMKPEFVDHIPSHGLQSLASLKTLEIQQGNLTELKSTAFSDMLALEELLLDGNDIVVLQRNSISNLPSLKKLSLRDNLLQEILAESLVGLINLSELLLDRNKIKRVEGCAFCDLQNLKSLELQNNQITDLTEYMFRGLRYLKRLDLYKNQIRILNDKVFHSLTRLSELDLRENIISHIAPNAFQGLEQLQMLYLNSNKIKTLPSQVFKPLMNLKDVQLLHNSLEVIEEELMENIPKVMHSYFMMSIRDNPLKCDCRLKWVSKYLSLVQSHHLKRELAELECDFDNGTMAVVHQLTFNCTERRTTMKPKAETVQLVPIEIHQRRENKSTVVPKEDAYLKSQDDDEDDEEDAEDIVMNDTEPLAGGCCFVQESWTIMSCAVLMVVLNKWL